MSSPNTSLRIEISTKNKMDSNIPNTISDTVPKSVQTPSAIQLKNLFNFFSILLFAAGLGLIIWASGSVYFRDNENFLSGKFCLPLSFGISCLILSVSLATQWLKSAFWFGLALNGQAVALQLIDAGPNLHYQHYRPLNEIFTHLSPIVWGFLIVQTIIVIIGVGFYLSLIGSWFKANLRVWQLLIIAAFFFIPTATVSENILFYIQEWFFAGFIQLINLANIILFALSIPSETSAKWRNFGSQLLGDLKTETEIKSALPDWFSLSLAIWVIALSALLNIYSYQQHPHVPDEVAYLTHARFLANGVLTMPSPPVPEGFEVYLMKINGNYWYPAPPPGWAMILAVGTFFGIPWLVNPLLAGLNILLVYLLLRELYSQATARLSIFLLSVSPWYIFLAMSFMTHIFALTCVLLATLFITWSRRKDKASWALAGGFVLGMLSLIRPLEAAAMAGLLGLWAIGLGGKRLKFSGICGLVLGTMLIGGLGLYYNTLLTGSPTKFPLNVYTDEYFGPNSNAYGFGPDRGMGWALDPNPGHSPIDALINTNLNVSTINTELFGWSIGSFLLIGVWFCLGKHQRSDYLMLVVIAAIYTLHFFYYFSGGPDFAARYWFLMIVPLVVLTARGIQILGEKFKDANLRFSAVIISLCLIALLNFIPWRAIDKYHHFRGMRPDIRYLEEKYNFGKSLVLIQGNKHPDYDSAMIYNPLDFNADAPIYAWDKDSETRRKLLTYYANRPVWIIKSPSLTQRGFEVVSGPLKTEELLREYEK